MRILGSIAVVAGALVLPACASPSEVPTETALEQAPQASETLEGPSVVVTTTILGSVVGDILTCAIGTDSTMTVLMPIGADPHDFQPSSAQVADMAQADLVVANGLMLEEGLDDALDNLAAEGVPILSIAELVDPLPFGDENSHDDHDHEEEGSDDHDHEEEGSHDHDHGEFDPHFWLDMDRVAQGAIAIGEALAEQGDSTFDECGHSVAQSIRDAESEVVTVLDAVSDENRVLLTDHDAFGYFAQRYGFRVVGVVIPGGSTLGEPNSEELADLVRIIRSQGITAIFGNTAASTEVLEILSTEVGGQVSVVELFVGSLGGPGSGAENYIDMMKTNASRISTALGD
ncbi:MAG: hypothetical protein RL187_30 [Actinomycetota bacterium]